MGVDEGFDALEGRYGNMIEMGIIDPLRVARSALQNGASVAGLLLTTNTLVAEEQTPWGGSRALMTEFGAAGRGPAPALARLQHAAVAGPRPVGRVSVHRWPARDGQTRRRHLAAVGPEPRPRVGAAAAAVARPAAGRGGAARARRSSPRSPTSTRATSRPTSRRRQVRLRAGLGHRAGQPDGHAGAVPVRQAGRRHRARPARAVPRAASRGRSRVACGCRPSWSRWPPTWPSSSAPRSG